MFREACAVACAVVALASALPTPIDLEDTESVGSYIREVRAAAPPDYYRSYDNEGEGEIGYSRKKGGGGKKGYQHFDAYHKKAGDAYAFEKEDSYGDEDEGHKGAYSERHEQKAGKYQETPSEHDEVPRSAELRDEPEGESDGNGGVEAIGHDPADYILPEKYTYGNGDEYDF